MSGRRGRAPADTADEANNDMWIPGLGQDKPQARVLGTSFFGYVPDAYSMKTPNMPSESPSRAASKTTSRAESPSREVPEAIAAEEPVAAVEAAATLEALPLDSNDQSAQNRLLIKHGKVVNADGIQDADIYVEEGVINQLGRNLIVPGGARVIDARGKYVIPGGIDPHTHFELPFMGTTSADDFYSGTRAAIAGGTTTILDFVIPSPGQSLSEAVADWQRKAEEKACCDYGFHVALTQWNDGTPQQMEEVIRNQGINSFKMFMAYKGTWQLNNDELLAAMEKCGQIGAVAMVHAENGDAIAVRAKKLLEAGVKGPEGHALSRPEEVEAEAVLRACVLADAATCPLYVVHVMSKSAAQQVAERRQAGAVVFGEPIAASLATDGTHYWNTCWKHAAAHVMSPPLRPDPETPAALMEHLAKDHLQVTGSDHCTFSSEQKSIGEGDFTRIPNGVNGVEERMAILWENGVVKGLLDPARFVAVTSTNAAKIFGLYPQKGCLAVGSDADIVIWDPTKTRTFTAAEHHSRVDFNVFEGLTCHGVPEYVIVGGRVVVDEGDLKVVGGWGKRLDMAAYPQYVYDMMNKRQQAIPGGTARTPNAASPSVAASVVSSTNGLSTPNQAGNESASPSLSPRPMSPAQEPAQSASQNPVEHLSRGPTRSGGRNMQDTTFSISADYPNAAVKEEEDKSRKSSIQVKAPPGGKSSGPFW